MAAHFAGNRRNVQRMNPGSSAVASPTCEAAVSITDEALMLRYARHGDAAAFESLYRRHRASLLRYLHRNTGSGAFADELFQDIWLSVVRARAGYRPSAAFRTWLFTLAHNRLVDHYRQHGRQRAVLQETRVDEPLPDAPAPESATPHAQSEQRQLAQRLLRLIAELPQDQRDAFLLKEEGGFGLEDIACITGAGAETVKSRLRYAVAKLREGLEAAHAR
jgi:RNA polymerase sigma-70 factor (ECF subfamily)